MKFDSLAELKIYNGISQPIIIIDKENVIVYSNLHAESFFKVILNDSYIGKNINEIITFKDDNENEIEYIDFYNHSIEELNIIADINIYKLNKIKINMAKVKIKDCSYKLMVISELEVKKNFFNTPKEDVEENTMKKNLTDFIYMNIKDVINDYEGEKLSEQLSIGIVNGTSTAIVVEKNGIIMFVNKATLEVLSTTSENIFVGKSFSEVVKVLPMDCDDKYIQEQYETSNRYNVTYKKIIKIDGNYIFCEITTMFLEEDNEKYNIYLLKDITSKVKMEIDLAASKNSYIEFLELIPMGVMIYTKDRFNSGNKAQAKIFGVENMNMLYGVDIISMIHEESKQIYKEMYYNAKINCGPTDVQELKIIRQDGKVIEVEMGMMAINLEGEKSIVIISQEITYIKRAKIDKLRLEETLKYDKLKTEFISNVSHELKTPLNIILSTVQLLQHSYEDSGDEQLTRYLNLTKTNSYRLLRLINNLIDGTRIDVGNLKMDFGNYNIVKIVEDITMEAVEYVEAKGLTLTFDTNVEEKIIGVDKDNIERIILNLLSNAVKFSKENGRIYVHIINEDNVVKIIVGDNGKGISKKNQKKIFDKFVQVDNLFTRTAEGSGIGLSLVKSIILNHGGNIYVKSKLEHGSEFTVELPNILSKNTSGYNAHTINQVTSKEKVKIEFSDI